MTYGEAAMINRETLSVQPGSRTVIQYLDIGSVSAPGRIKATQILPAGDAPSRARRRVRAGDTLVSTVRPQLRAIVHFADVPANLIASTGFAVLSPNPEVDPKFLYQATLRAEFTAELVKRQTGSNYPAVRPADIAQLPLLLPPLPEQRQIAAILTSVDETIEKTESVIQGLHALRRDLLSRLFAGASAGWLVSTLDSIAYVQTGIAKGKPREGLTVDVPYLRVANVQDGFLDLQHLKTIKINSESLGRYSLRRGDVLFTEGGDADKLGRGCVWQGEIEPCLHQNHVFAVRVDKDILLPEFLSYFGSSPAGRSYFLNCAKQTTNLASINSSQLKAMPVPIPTLPEQQEIVTVMTSVETYIRNEERVQARLLELKSSLANVLLTGRIRVRPEEATS